ncbi:hypothetical protein [uncultured Bacteroides sp.]|uniref:hypothetical protein n=1 Tax=uncultured Bacteroides sp. TaxID=162156 RepID=UPI0025959C3E|nr:hypothetical protein [uncultured Bacteroides sp.]
MKFSAKEKDRVLNQLESSFFKFRNEIKGDDSNELIIDELKKDEFVIVESMFSHDMDRIYLTNKGESFKRTGGYSYIEKKERIKRIKNFIPNLIKMAIGFFSTILIFAVFRILSQL